MCAACCLIEQHSRNPSLAFLALPALPVAAASCRHDAGADQRPWTRDHHALCSVNNLQCRRAGPAEHGGRPQHLWQGPSRVLSRVRLGWVAGAATSRPAEACCYALTSPALAMQRLPDAAVRQQVAPQAAGLLALPPPCAINHTLAGASAAGLNRLAHFLALDTFDHGGTVMRSAVYFIMYYSFASPRCCVAGLHCIVATAEDECCTALGLNCFAECSTAVTAAAPTAARAIPGVASEKQPNVGPLTLPLPGFLLPCAP